MGIENDDKKESPNLRKILLVDDDDSLRYIVEEYFYRVGFDVVLASDGDEAFELFNKESFDIVITDVRMPRMNGLKLLGHIKTNFPRCPVILMTGFELSQKDVANMRYSADAYIAKPFKLDSMRKIVESLLDKK